MGDPSTTIQRRRWWRRGPNPLLIKELRGRMRGARAFVVLTIYLLLLSCFATIIYASAYSASYSGSGLPEMADLGQAVFYGVVIIEIFMVTFITPAFTAGAISGERERRTYELLRATLLPARRLVTGKLGSAMIYMFLLIMAAVPLEGLAFMLGGVIIEELFLAIFLLLVTAFFFGVLGLLLSSFLRTTLASTVLVYAIALIITIGLPIILLISSALIIDPILYGYSAFVIPKFMEILLFYLLYLLISASPIAVAVLTEIILVEESSFWYFWIDLATTRVPAPSAWIIYSALYIGLALILLLITMLRVRRQERR